MLVPTNHLLVATAFSFCTKDFNLIIHWVTQNASDDETTNVSPPSIMVVNIKAVTLALFFSLFFFFLGRGITFLRNGSFVSYSFV